MKRRKVIILLVALGHFVLTLLAASQTSFQLIPAPADTIIHAKPFFDTVTIILLAPLVLLVWLGEQLDSLQWIKHNYLIWVIYPPVCLITVPLNSWLSALFFVWLWPKLKKLKRPKTEQDIGQVSSETAVSDEPSM